MVIFDILTKVVPIRDVRKALKAGIRERVRADSSIKLLKNEMEQ